MTKKNTTRNGSKALPDLQGHAQPVRHKFMQPHRHMANHVESREETLANDESPAARLEAQLRRARSELASIRKELSQVFNSAPAGCLLLADDMSIKRANVAACAMLGTDRPTLLANPFTRFVAPDSHYKLAQHQVAAAGGEKIVTGLLLQRMDGSQFEAQIISFRGTSAKRDSHGLHTWIVNVSDHKQDNHALLASEQRCHALFEQAPLCMFMVDLAPPLAVIRAANSRAHLVYGYEAGELHGTPLDNLVPDDTRAVVRSTVAQVQQGLSVANETVHRRRDGTLFTVRVNAIVDPTEKQCMLMIVEDTTAELLRRSEVQAIDAERRRMSHEIHDSVAQRLAALNMRSALWHRLTVGAAPAMQTELTDLRYELNAAIEDIRRAIFAVRPVDLNEMGFFAGVTKWVNGFSLQNKLTIQLNFTGPREKLPADYELPLFRIIQEAFSNILRHAGASTARIGLAVDAAGGVVLTVGDDGRGFDPARIGPAAEAPHFGLPQMRERLMELAGTLTIQTEIGRGTTLIVKLPPITRQGQDDVYRGPQRRMVARRRKDRS